MPQQKTKAVSPLNKALMNGPIHQPPLFTILIKFRKYIVAFSSYVERMYQCIEVDEKDRNYQSLLWRFDTKDPLHIYELTTLTYGTSPAAYIATEYLQEIGKAVPERLPEVVEAITDEFWLDDELSGADTVEEAIVKAKQIYKALITTHFPLRKYVSNSQKFLNAFLSEQVEKLRSVAFSSSGTAKILDLEWYPTEDEFRISCKAVDMIHWH